VPKRLHVKTDLPLRLPFHRDMDVKSLLAAMSTTDDPHGKESVEHVSHTPKVS